ncbi:Uncharacterised protein [Mycobacteroides abscessus subsp. abscessus]|nr:Uncharacterised protein [Mycobacteroides abscessus subsp. abscessus]
MDGSSTPTSRSLLTLPTFLPSLRVEGEDKLHPRHVSASPRLRIPYKAHNRTSHTAPPAEHQPSFAWQVRGWGHRRKEMN